jgi:multisubunit Na+/H+ antiporter MnhG subunit
VKCILLIVKLINIMENKLSLIADICGIIGFVMSLVAVGGVVRINKKINSNKISTKDTTIGGDFTGRDKISK